MRVNRKHYRTIWAVPGENQVRIIDQRWLPHRFEIERLADWQSMVTAIRDMHIRGAGAIGAAAGYGMYLAVAASGGPDVDETISRAATRLKAARPTAVNLEWAVDRQLDALRSGGSKSEKKEIALRVAGEIAEDDVECCRRIGEHGLEIIRRIAEERPDRRVNVLTHCNAGWLAFVDFGTATAPIYRAHDAGIDVHVWVDETRPRNQGARLTAWELEQHGVPYTVIADNAGGHLMQHGQVDLVLVGSDRTTYTGFVANKIGTYLKALAARDNGVPFYVALPSATIDWTIRDGAEIPIEERPAEELKYIQGLFKGEVSRVLLTPENANILNVGFDVTPPHLVTGLITERGVLRPDENEILGAFPEHASAGRMAIE